MTARDGWRPDETRCDGRSRARAHRFKQAQAEGVHLGIGELGAVCGAAEHIHEDVGGGVQEQAKLVGPEAVTAQAVGLERPLEVLDGVFAGVGSLHVATVVQLLGVTSKIGHHEANVRALLGVLGFDDHDGSCAASACDPFPWSDIG